MTQSRRPISFLATSTAEKTTQFYTRTMGLRLIDASPYALVFADGDTMLRIQLVQDLTPAPFTAHGWQTDDIEADINDLGTKGVAFLRFDPLAQDASGIWTSPDGHKIAWFKDPSGNILSLSQYVEP